MDGLEKIINYEFADKSLLEECLTHPSLVRQKGESDVKFNYERLEFLGDSVLGLIIAELLINKYPDEKEGALAKRHAGLVKGDTVASVAKNIGIGSFIQMTQGEEQMGGRENKSNIENAMEALIGAVYMDGGIEKVRNLVAVQWAQMLDDMKEPPRDAKTALQEWAQGRGLPIPEYKIVNTKGPAHNPDFEVEVFVEGFQRVIASGKSKKKAEKKAAQNLLKIINDGDK